jgi:dolichol-phosphate mannosyltransferase
MGASLWLFLPTYNEAGNVEGIVRATAAQLERAAPGDWRVLVVDDASPDGTGDLADRLAEEIAGVEVLHRPGKEGLGRAYLSGFAHALAGGAELVIVMDADFSHDPDYLPALVAAAGEADLVLGSRYVAGGRIADWPPLRRLLSRFGSLYARMILGVGVNDLTSGFRCVRRRVLESVEPSTLRAQGYVFNIELTYRALLAGFTVTEVPIVFRDRKAGESKMSLPIAIEALMLVPKLRSLRRPVVRQRGEARAGRRIRWRSRRWPKRPVLGSAGAEAAGEGSTGLNGDVPGGESPARQDAVGDPSAP